MMTCKIIIKQYILNKIVRSVIFALKKVVKVVVVVKMLGCSN